MSKKIVVIIGVVLFVVGIWLYKAGLLQYGTNLAQENICKDCNVVLITMTNLRYDHISRNGYFRKTTPNIDILMEENVVFENAFSHASWTLPEAMTIYTGLYPFEHNVTNRRAEFKLNPKTPTMVDTLKSAGYVTTLFSGGFDYDPSYGLTNRFDVNEVCKKTNGAEEEINFYGELGCSVPKAINWLTHNTDKKFFMHVQGYDAHCPFYQGKHFFDPDYTGKIDFSRCHWTFKKEKPVYKDGKTYSPVLSSVGNGSDTILLDEKDAYHMESLYDEGILNADQYIGQLLAAIENQGLTDKTIIIVTSEHGDMFGKYGRFMRGGPLSGTFYDDVLHIPLVIKIPTIDHKKITTFAEHVDLYPTILSMIGIDSPKNTSGISLVPSMVGKSTNREYVFAGSTFTPEDGNLWVKNSTRTSSIRSMKWKLIKTETLEEADIEYELFNMVSDPQELNDVKATEQKIFALLAKKLESWEKNKIK